MVCQMNLLSASAFSGEGSTSSAELVTLKNRNGLVAQFTNYGARWVSMWTPDRDGCMGDILLGFDTLDGYLTAGEQYHGAIVGRVCGRINNARFTLEGQEFLLASNDAYGKPVRKVEWPLFTIVSGNPACLSLLPERKLLNLQPVPQTGKKAIRETSK